MLESITLFFVNSPFYPHWLMNKKMRAGNQHVLKGLHGRVLEIGAGDGTRKKELMLKHKRIKEYIASDYSNWDKEFRKVSKNASLLGRVTEIFYGFQIRAKLDLICNAMDLPLSDRSFDFHLSFEVLEHISDPYIFLSEASRVLKKKGRIILSVPFFFRIHGGEPKHKMDYFRYAPGFFYEIAKKNNLKLKALYANTGLGTTLAEMVNQWIILQIREGSLIKKIGLLPLCLIIFPTSNLIGYIIDMKPDKRFPIRFHVVLEKC